ncbi:MAG TPA: CheR family methyltransferase [Xenococcaceae cyanobacterium]
MNQLLWEKLINLIAQNIGFHVKPKDYQNLETKIQQRINFLNLENIGDYYNFLKNSVDAKSETISLQEKYQSEKEWNTLAKVITNGESFFFRDRGQFALLKETIIPQLIKQKRQAYKNKQAVDLRLKIWSSGCSMGQEPYSLAILIHQLIPDLSQWNISIIGTDINQDFLNKARAGIYQNWSFRLSEPALKRDYFTAIKEGWQVNHQIKKMVNFYQDNIVQDTILPAPCHGVDLILCRNVFIYFEKDSVTKGINKFYSALNPKGYFITGHAELQGVSLKGFKTLSFPKSIIYQRLENGTREDFIPTTEAELNSDIELVNFQDNNLLQPIKDLAENINQFSADSNNLQQESLIADFETIINDNLLTDANNLTSNWQTETILPAINNNPEVLSPVKPVADRQITDNLKNDNLLSSLKQLVATGEYNRVIELGQQAIQQQPNDYLLCHLVAQAYANRGNLEPAEQHCQKALEINSTFLPALYLWAQIAESKHNPKKAKELLKRIIYLEPTLIAAYLELGAIYLSEADLNRANKMYHAAYEILQELPSDAIVDYQGTVTASQLKNHLKQKLGSIS